MFYLNFWLILKLLLKFFSLLGACSLFDTEIPIKWMFFVLYICLLKNTGILLFFSVINEVKGCSLRSLLGPDFEILETLSKLLNFLFLVIYN